MKRLFVLTTAVWLTATGAAQAKPSLAFLKKKQVTYRQALAADMQVVRTYLRSDEGKQQQGTPVWRYEVVGDDLVHLYVGLIFPEVLYPECRSLAYARAPDTVCVTAEHAVKVRRALRRVHAKIKAAKRALATGVPTGYPPHYRAWLCIHHYEGSWNDPGAPYYGGLQMDWSFMSTYGGKLLRLKGTADRWTPLEQMWVAERAYSSGRGFYPWPNTARYCGLI